MQQQFENNFLKVSKQVEKFCKNYSIKGTIPPEHRGIWLPQNEVRAWAIPRRSAELLRLLVAGSKAKTVLELGTSCGYSTMWLAAGVRGHGGKIYTVDLIEPKIKIAKKHLKQAQVSDCVTHIQGNIREVLARWNKKIDFVFMDADKANYLSYIKQIEKYLNPGAMIVADNAVDYGDLMKDYLRYVSKNPRYRSHLLEIDNGLMITVKV